MQRSRHRPRERRRHRNREIDLLELLAKRAAAMAEMERRTSDKKRADPDLDDSSKRGKLRLRSSHWRTR